MAQFTVMASGPRLLIAIAGPAVQVPRPPAGTAFSLPSNSVFLIVILVLLLLLSSLHSH